MYFVLVMNRILNNPCYDHVITKHLHLTINTSLIPLGALLSTFSRIFQVLEDAIVLMYYVLLATTGCFSLLQVTKVPPHEITVTHSTYYVNYSADQVCIKVQLYGCTSLSFPLQKNNPFHGPFKTPQKLYTTSNAPHSVSS